jgi:hypothetical protein
MANNPELNAQSKVGAIIGISIGFAALSTVVVSCRIYTRAILKSTGIDDAGIVVTQVRPISSRLKRDIKIPFGMIDEL